MAQKQALGKGLASLFPGLSSLPGPHNTSGGSFGQPPLPPQVDFPISEAPNRDRHPGISVINVDEIKENKYQPRHEFEDQPLRELAASIKANGVIQPLVVRKHSNGSYELIAGERRLRASKLAGVKQVPIVIRKASDREALELALVENIQRENLNCVEEARAYFQLQQEFNLTQDEVAARVGKERATVANYLRLLDLPEDILRDLKEGRLSFGHGRAILGIEGHENRLQARAEVLEKCLSVRSTEALIQAWKQNGGPGQSDSKAAELSQSTEKDPVRERLSHAGQDLTRKWSLKVDIQGNDKRGKIIFHYNTRQDLDRLLETLHT